MLAATERVHALTCAGPPRADGKPAACCWRRYDAVIHFAGRKYVGESVTQPFLYYDNNIKGTINLIEVMSKSGCKNVRAI